jgi:spore maturation protein B
VVTFTAYVAGDDGRSRAVEIGLRRDAVTRKISLPMAASVAMFRAAGGIDVITRFIGPALNAVQFPTELLPLVLIRPLSGSGANGLFAELVQAHGPDSLITRMGATVLGSSETTFYVLAVYFGSVAIRRTRHAVPAGLVADLFGVAASVIICRLVFGA